MPGINPDTNDWTRQFFETHVFYWQRLVESPSPGSPRAPLAVGFEATEGLSRPEKTEETEEYGPGDRKGKKPADRNLRGGFDTACSIYPLRRNPRRIRLLNSRRNSRKVRNYRLSTMNNYFNSSDMANSVPRQAPSPGPQHQTNGIGGNSIASLNNSVLPAGQQADMNHLWGVVEQLSQILADNRAQTANIVNSVQQIQSRAVANGASPTIASLNHDLQNSGSAQQLSHLTQELTQLQNSHASLQHSHAALLALLTSHETLLDTHILPQLRRYAHSHTLAITSLHAHYQRLLEDERQQNLELRLEHQKWQEGLGRVNRWARLALRESGEEEGRRKERQRLGRLREENRVLRGLVGWEARGEESEDE
ncbi:hypothetical protein EV356DRAFT_471239, partial [Viridothelium virens]